MRFTVNLHHVKNDKDNVGNKFPLNTFVTNNTNTLLEELSRLLANDISGINKIVILDSLFGKLGEANIGMCKINVDKS